MTVQELIDELKSLGAEKKVEEVVVRTGPVYDASLSARIFNINSVTISKTPDAIVLEAAEKTDAYWKTWNNAADGMYEKYLKSRKD